MRWASIVVVVVACSGGGGTKQSDAPAPTPETAAQCYDGIDNNNDGVADCADPTCAQVVACVSAVPAGWSGYWEVFDGVTASAPSSCSAPWSQLMSWGNSGVLTAPDAMCGPCVCGAADMGVCPAAGGTATLPATSWASASSGCLSAAVTVATGCTGGMVCVPKSTATFASGVCIVSDGDVSCPTGSAFANRHLFYASVDDTRGCSACVCGAAAANACAPSGGAANGSAAPAMPTTACCM